MNISGIIIRSDYERVGFFPIYFDSRNESILVYLQLIKHVRFTFMGRRNDHCQKVISFCFHSSDAKKTSQDDSAANESESCKHQLSQHNPIVC